MSEGSKTSVSEHTKTPWTFDERDRDDVIAAGDDVVCRIPNHPENGRNWRANAAFIVECVNNHARLTAELEIARKALEDIAFGTRVPEHKKDDTAFLRAGCCIAHQFATAALQGQQK